MIKKFCVISFALQTSLLLAQPCATGTLSANQTLCAGATPSALTVTGYLSGGHVQWQTSTNNSTFTNLGPGDTLNTYQPVALSATRYYRVEISPGTSGSTCETAFSSSLTITIQAPPTAPTGITGGGNTLCNGANATLQAIGGSEGAGADYQWGSGTVIGNNLIETTDNGTWTTPPLAAESTFWVRRVASPASACSNTTSGVSQQISVRPAIAVSITNPGELCQLPDQLISVTNLTAGQPEIRVLWSSFNGQSGSVNFISNVSIPLDLTEASNNSNFNINGFEFATAPLCSNLNAINQIFDIKSRPSVNSISHNDLTATTNTLCEGYGPVEFFVDASDEVAWQASYFIDGDLIEQPIIESPFPVNIDSTGVHVLIIDSIWYAQGLSCGHNPADYASSETYSHQVTIKPTPPPVELIENAPSILQFCNYANPLIVDSVARIEDLNSWVLNSFGYELEWKGDASNAASNLNNVPLMNGEVYFPVYELNGCQSIIDEESASFLIDLLSLPNLSQSVLLYDDSICSGVPFELGFNPAVNISHFSISDFNFANPLSSSSISSTIHYPNSPTSNLSIVNSGNTAVTWTANVYALNKNVSLTNSVTCYSQPVAIDIVVNPNATLTPLTANFASCENGPDFTIDPGWNGVGDVDWILPVVLPAPFTIDPVTKIISVNMTTAAVDTGAYPIRIVGGFFESNCTVDTTFIVNIYPTPDIAASILDVDQSICHNEFTTIRIDDAKPGVQYDWTCTGCETKGSAGASFVAQWTNAKPDNGVWSDGVGTYSISAVDTTTDAVCSSTATSSVDILGSYASCPEGIDFFLPNGLSLVDQPALYFQWYSVESDTIFNPIANATGQTYFPNETIADCDVSKYVVASSLYPNSCWSTTVNCFETFGLRDCLAPKSLAYSGLNLFPNPSTGSGVFLTNLDPNLEGLYKVELIDNTGKIQYLRMIRLHSEDNYIEFPKLAVGIYTFRIANPKHLESLKLIIQ